jgi:glycosyltransferase involved in cell wall biosynthesis
MVDVFFDHVIFSRQEIGGISRYIVQLIKEFSKNDVSAKVITPLHSNRLLRSLGSKDVKGCDLQWPSFYRYKGFFLTLNHTLSPLITPNNIPHVIHETYYSRYPALRFNVPKVLTVHDCVHERFPKLFNSNDNTLSLKRKSIERANHIICISQNTKNDLIHFYNVPESKISVIYHGIESNSVNNLEGYVARKPYFLYVGGRANYKNFSVLLKAFALSSNLRHNTMIIAFGGGEFTPSEKRQISELGLFSNIEWASGPDDLLNQYYKGALALVYPSLYEGFGFPPLEAMRFGCPVLASNSSCIPEITGNAAYLFDPTIEEELLLGMEKILGDVSYVEDLKKKGAVRIQQFQWANTGELTAQVYKNLL